MNKNFKGLVLILLIFFLIPVLAGCGDKGKDPVTPDSNQGEDQEELFLTTVVKDTVKLTVDDTYQIPFETNIKEGLNWEVSNPDVLKIDDKGLVTAVGKGKAVVDCYYNDLSFFVKFEVKGKVVPPKVTKLTIYGYDEIVLENRGLTLYIYLKDAYGQKMYKNYPGLTFNGYFLDANFTQPIDYQAKVFDNLTIYPKYIKDETRCKEMITIDKVLVQNDEVVLDDKIQAFTADFGATTKYNDLTYTDAMFITVSYEIDKAVSTVKSILVDGSKENTVIPYNGYVLMVPKTNAQYDEIRNNVKVNDEIALDAYSILRAGKAYVNKEYVKHADKVNLNVDCRYVSVYDVYNDVTIYEKQGSAKTYPASTTKIITAIAALEYAPLDLEIEVGDELDVCYEGSDPSTAGLVKGQVWTLRQLLYALLLPSGNDAAYTIARGVAEYVPANKGKDVRTLLSIFNGYMNDVKDKVGATGSHFMVPDGNSYYESDGSWSDRISNHYVTANDMVKFAKYGFNIPGLAKVVSTPTVKFNIVSGENIAYNNTNRLLRANDANYYPYAVGMKTGTTNPAGQCLVAGAEKDGRFIIVAVMNNSGSRFYNAKHIFEQVLK